MRREGCLWWVGANYILTGISGGQNNFLHVSKLEICLLYCDLEEGQNCCLVQVKLKLLLPVSSSEPGRLQPGVARPVLCSSVNCKHKHTWRGKTGVGDLREQRPSSEQKETLRKGCCLLSLFIKSEAVDFYFRCGFSKISLLVAVAGDAPAWSELCGGCKVVRAEV